MKQTCLTLKRVLALLLLSAVLLTALPACGAAKTETRIAPAVVLLPMFEVGELAGDFPGEAQLYYEAYFPDPACYEITGEPFGCSLYVQDDLALCLLGQGKSTAAVNLTALLCDERFDFSRTLFLMTGCAGSATEFGVVGDVYLITAAVDYDLGHTMDVRDLEDPSGETWFRTPDYDPMGCILLDVDLTDRAYALTSGLSLATTDSARACMARNFDDAAWALRDPQVLLGASVTSDNYWKGEYSHQKAVAVAESYQTPDPYAATVMEDAAVALAFQKLGMLDQLLILRASVNVDVFIDGQTPEVLWAGAIKVSDEGFDGFDDIFPVAMENCFLVGRTLIEAVRAGELGPAA